MSMAWSRLALLRRVVSRGMLRVLLLVAASGLLAGCAAWHDLFQRDQPDPAALAEALAQPAPSSTDVAVVLGCPSEDDGRPSLCLQCRVHAAQQVLAQGRVRALIFSGGAAHNRHVEAEVMAGLAQRRGVGREQILLEGQSLTTWQNLLSASSDRLLIVWQLETGNEVLRLSGHTGAVNTCTISADGKRALSGGYDKTLRLWDLSAGNEIIRLIGHSAPITACLITDDGRRAISASLDYTLRIWDLMSGMCIETIYGSSAYLCLTNGRDWLVAGDQAGNVWILRDQIMTTPSSETRLTRQSLMESVRKFLNRSSTSHSSTSQR